MKKGDVCYGVLRAAACVDESDHHALISPHVWHGQTVREDRVSEASARRPSRCASVSSSLFYVNDIGSTGSPGRGRDERDLH